MLNAECIIAFDSAIQRRLLLRSRLFGTYWRAEGSYTRTNWGFWGLDAFGFYLIFDYLCGKL